MSTTFYQRVLFSFSSMLLAVVFGLTGGVFAQSGFCETPGLSVSQTECESLMMLYTSTNGDSWTNNTGRGNSTDVGSWYGVTVENIGGTNHVTRLSLSSNNLLGSLPDALSVLAELKELTVANNSIISLSDSIGSLASLETLNVQSNLLSVLPETIGDLDALTIFYAQNNRLTFLPDGIGDMTNLDILYVQNNDLTALPNTLSNLGELDILNLSNNQLISLPTSLGDLTDLDVLDLENNVLVSLPVEIGNLSSLTDLDIEANQLVSLPSTMGGLTNLVTLDVSYNQLSSLPAGFDALTSLQVLNLEFNNLTEISDTIGGLPALETIRLNANQLSSFPRIVTESTLLEYIYLQDNRLVGTFPQQFDQLGNVKRLYTYINFLDRTNTHNAQVPASLSAWYAGVRLAIDVFQGDIEDPTITLGSTFSPLISDALILDVDVEENSYAIDQGGNGMPYSFTGGGLCQTIADGTILANTGTVSLALGLVQTGIYQNCELWMEDHEGNQSNILSLPSFVFSENLTDFCDHPDISIPVTECHALVELYAATNGPSWSNNQNWLVSTDIESRHGVQLGDRDGGTHVVGLYLHKITSGDMHGPARDRVGNNLQGVLPDSFASLTYLEQFNASGNPGLIGTLPADIGNLSSLQWFVIQGGGLSGTLPASLENRTDIIRFDISENNLSGVLSGWMSSWSTVQIFHIADNDFSGTLPDEIATLDTLYYLNVGGNRFGGALPSSFGNASNFQYVYLHNNEFVGSIPSSRTLLDSLQTLELQNNNLDRDANHFVKIPGSLQSWMWSINTVKTDSQGDITSPSIVGTGVFPWLVTEPQQFTLTVSENSYAIDLDGDGMETVFSGGASCSNLSGSTVSVASGNDQVTIEVMDPGLYEGCLIGVVDHAGNISNYVALPRFGYTTTNEAICFNPDITVPVDECVALMQIYSSTNGLAWVQRTGWGESADVGSRYGVTVVDAGMGPHVVTIDLENNNLDGVMVVDSSKLSHVQHIDVGQNALVGMSTQWSGFTQLKVLRADNNLFNEEIWSDLSVVETLEVLNLSNNNFFGQLPSAWSFDFIKKLDLSFNTLSGELPTAMAAMHTLQEIYLQGNQLVGSLPSLWSSLDQLIHLDLSSNGLNREADHTVEVPVSLTDWASGILYFYGSNQDDTLAPLVVYSGTVPEIVANAFTGGVQIQENSYAINEAGTGMTVSFDGPGRCITLQTPDSITQKEGTQIITLIPGEQGVYTSCELVVTDHAGNTGRTLIPDFTFSFSCGDGIIDEGEECDEGRFCNNGTDCTDDISVCPGECQPRFVDGCTPRCLGSWCGDTFLDSDGIDNILGNSDDEQCDEGSYCNDGTDCTWDASICPGGEAECQPRLVNGCTSQCTYSTCGDGFVDIDGVDDILGNSDDENCDDGNLINGDGCYSNCHLESCGDGYLDEDGPDNIVGTSDDEDCDLGASNGLIGGGCTTSCTLPADSCFSCALTCNGGDETHGVFLMIDVSGSMNGHNRLDNTQDAHNTFLDLIPPGVIGSGGQIASGTIAGIIGIDNSAELYSDPIGDIAVLTGIIEDLNAGASTNYADALQIAYDYFVANPGIADGLHVVLLSDGEPSHPGGRKNARDAAIDVADDIKGLGIEIYTVGLQQTEDGSALLFDISSGSGFHYDDPYNNQLTDIYTEIYASIHCDCFNQTFCPVCGDGSVDFGEDCDTGSYCDDGRDCTNDASLCSDECAPRFQGSCTDQCVFTYCGDGVTQDPNHAGQSEACDDGNTISGDGCTGLCEVESCGDGYFDQDGADNIWLTADDEQCDDGNTDNNDECSNSCTLNIEGSVNGECHEFGLLYSFFGDGSNPPNEYSLCDAGTATGYVYNELDRNWTWYCLGINGGANVGCSAQESYCGDGITQQFSFVETCDDGNTDADDGCSHLCEFEPPLQSVGGARECFIGQTPVFQINEPIPLPWQLNTASGVDTDAKGCADLDEAAIIPGASLTCHFSVYHGNELANSKIAESLSFPCIAGIDDVMYSGLLLDFLADHTIASGSVLGHGFLNSIRELGNSPLGKYRLSLDKVSYTYCSVNELNESIELEVVYNGIELMEGPICVARVSITEPYLTQKGSSFGTIQPPSFETYMAADGSKLLYDGIQEQVQHSKVDSYSRDVVQYLTQKFVNDYRWSAKEDALTFGANRLLRKVPYKDIYFFKGSDTKQDIRVSGQLLTDLSRSFTVIIESADLIVAGNLEGNGIYIVKNGKIIFDHQDCDTTQLVEGIFVTNEGFELTNTQNYLERGEWCNAGNFILKGMLVGPGIDESISNQRRALLDVINMPLLENSDVVDGLDMKQITTQQKSALYESSAVSIQTDPSAWRDLPEGVTALFDAMVVVKE